MIKLASGFEAATQVRAKNLPTFADTVPSHNIQGTTPVATKGSGGQHPAKEGSQKKMPHHHM